MGGRKKKTGGGLKKTTTTNLFDVSLVDLCDSSDNDDGHNNNNNDKKGIDIITLDDTLQNPDADDSAISVASLSLNSPLKSPSSTKTSPRKSPRKKPNLNNSKNTTTTKVKTKVCGKIRSFRKNENDVSFQDKETEDGECSDSDDDTDIEIVGVKMRTPSSVKKRKLKPRYFNSPFQHDITMSARRRKSLLNSTNNSNRFSTFTLTSSNTSNNSNNNNNNGGKNNNNNNQKFSLKPKLVGIRKKNKKMKNNFSPSPKTTTTKNLKLKHQLDASTFILRQNFSPISRIHRNPEYKHKNFYQNAIRKNAQNKNDKGIVKRSKFTIDLSSLHPSAVLQAQNALLLPSTASSSSTFNHFSLSQQQQQQPLQQGVPSSSSTATVGTERNVINTDDSLQISISPNNNNDLNTNKNTTNAPNIVIHRPLTQPQQSNWSMFGSNLYHSEREIPVAGSLRPVIIDGSNVAVSHGKCLNPQQDKGKEMFSCRGLKICSDYFKSRGHNRIIIFVPQFRKKLSQSFDTHVLDELEKEGILKCTPSRDVGTTGKRISSYDDRFIVQCAADLEGVIVSNDNFRDLYDEQPLWRDTITNRVLGFTWATESMLMFPPDPLGHAGPPLHEFLRFSPIPPRI